MKLRTDSSINISNSMLRKVLLIAYEEPVIKVNFIHSQQPILTKQMNEMSPDEIQRGVVSEKFNHTVQLKGVLLTDKSGKTQIQFSASCLLKNTGLGWKPESLRLTYDNNEKHYYRFEEVYKGKRSKHRPIREKP